MDTDELKREQETARAIYERIVALIEETLRGIAKTSITPTDAVVDVLLDLKTDLDALNSMLIEQLAERLEADYVNA